VFTRTRFASIPCLSLLVMAMLLFLAGCGGPSAMQTNQPSQANQISQATLVLDLDVDRYEFNTPASLCQAPMVAEAVAGSFGQSHWNTTNPVQPSLLSQALPTRQLKDSLIKGGYTIYTPVYFTSMTILRDQRSSKLAAEEFVMVGGQQGTTRISIGEFPQLKASTRYLVVVVPGLNATTHHLTLQWQVVYNAFPIDAQGVVTLQPAGSPNEPGAGKPQPAVTITLAALQQQLAHCP
jgi:hypothetical protein